MDYERLEAKRRAWEDLERVEEALAERARHSQRWLPEGLVGADSVLRDDAKRSRRQVLTQQYDAARLVGHYKEAAARLEQAVPTEDTAALSAALPTTTTEDRLAAFEEAFTRTQALPDGPAESLAQVYKRGIAPRGLGRYLSEFTADVDVDAIFSDAESFGRHLALAGLHEQYLNLPDALGLPYKQYVDAFADFDSGAYMLVRGSPAYDTYLSALHGYLESFYNRTRPLGPPVDELPDYDSTFSAHEATDQHADDPLFCEACQKRFASEGVYKAHLTGRKHRQAVQQLAMGDHSAAKPTSSALVRPSGPVLEHRIGVLVAALATEIAATRANLVRRGLLTEKERALEAELAARAIEKEDDGASDDPDDAAVRNSTAQYGQQRVAPDGTPIPNWLWKLQGLSYEFTCEICGNATYAGRKAFEKHYGDSKHQAGLRALGITPSTTFAGISSIAEALDLQRALRVEKTKALAAADAEVQDAHGNVMSKRAYDDLKRQGLL